MKHNSMNHQRRSIRLKDYDYSQNGAYFVTICTEDQEYLFGDISKERMVINEAGEMIKKWWVETRNKFKNIELDEFVIMPNHFHGIVNIIGADPHVYPVSLGEHVGSPLHRIVQWFKTMTTNEYIRDVHNNMWKPFLKRLWQRNYYEHVVRNEDKLNKIRQYIRTNSLSWHLDMDNPERDGIDGLEEEIFNSRMINQMIKR